MKILFLASDLNKYGGIQIYNRYLLQALRAHGHDVVVLELKRAGVLSKVLYSSQAVMKAALWKPDLVVCYHINFSSLAFLVKTVFGIPYTIGLYGIDVAPRKTWIQRAALTSASRILLIFNWTTKTLIEQYPSLKTKTFLLPSPVDGSRFIIKNKSKQLQERYRLTGYSVILTVARIEKSKRSQKGYDRVIRALPSVLREIPNVKYLLVGDGDDIDGVRSLIDELHLHDHVVIVGAVGDDELVDYYNLADLYVMPSKVEGFGIVFLEALACGKPVIAGQYSDEELLHGDLGITVNPDDLEEISHAIIMVLKKNTSPAILDQQILRKRVLETYGLTAFKQSVKSLVIQTVDHRQ